ncbi:MAG: hypothetical protein ACRD1A_06880, partial [Terriglobales bacterium]
LLFRSIPTIIIFVLLHFYLKRVLYRPLGEVLAARHARIQGKQEAARQTAAAAAAKLGQYEQAVRDQRMKNYRHMETRRQSALAAGQESLAAARQQSAEALTGAREQLAADTTAARQQLQAGSEALAADIITRVLASKALDAGKVLTSPGAGA